MKIKSVIILLAAMCISLTVALGSDKKQKKLTHGEALSLAVKLANQKCQEHFDSAPFDSATYLIEYKNSRWQWGQFDVHGINGYSARVTFDAKGQNDSVEVYFSTDKAVTPRESKKQLRSKE